MKVNDFLGAFDGGARSNLFKCNITGQKGGGAFPGAGPGFQVYVKAIQLPEHALGEIAVNHMGRIYKYPGDRVYNDVQLTVLSDADMKARHFFEAWNHAFNKHQDNQGQKLTGQSGGAVVELTHLERDRSAVRTYKLNNAWCSDVSAVDLSYDNMDALVEFTVTIKYHYFEVSGGKAGTLR